MPQSATAANLYGTEGRLGQGGPDHWPAFPFTHDWRQTYRVLTRPLAPADTRKDQEHLRPRFGTNSDRPASPGTMKSSVGPWGWPRLTCAFDRLLRLISIGIRNIKAHLPQTRTVSLEVEISDLGYICRGHGLEIKIGLALLVYWTKRRESFCGMSWSEPWKISPSPPKCAAVNLGRCKVCAWLSYQQDRLPSCCLQQFWSFAKQVPPKVPNIQLSRSGCTINRCCNYTNLMHDRVVR